MLPIRLTAIRNTGGFAFDETGAPDFMRAVSDETEPFVIEAPDLESPIALRLANCSSREDFLAFQNRFNDLSVADLSDLQARAEEVRRCVLYSLGKAARREAGAARAGVNGLLGGVTIKPIIRFIDGSPRMVLEVSTLADFMALEMAAAVEAGAVATTCSHCQKLFLTGPFTGRRSHARFCADRCRVAAMRARSAAKGVSQ